MEAIPIPAQTTVTPAGGAPEWGFHGLGSDAMESDAGFSARLDESLMGVLQEGTSPEALLSMQQALLGQMLGLNAQMLEEGEAEGLPGSMLIELIEKNPLLLEGQPPETIRAFERFEQLKQLKVDQQRVGLATEATLTEEIKLAEEAFVKSVNPKILTEALDQESLKIGVEEPTDARLEPWMAPAAKSESSSMSVAELWVHRALETTSVSRPERAELSRPVDVTTVIARVTEAISRSVAENRHQVEITLNPPELGTVRVEMRVQGQDVHVGLTVDQPSTEQILQTNLPDLKSSLSDRNLEVRQLSVQLSNGRAEQDASQFAGKRRPEQGSPLLVEELERELSREPVIAVQGLKLDRSHLHVVV